MDTGRRSFLKTLGGVALTPIASAVASIFPVDDAPFNTPSLRWRVFQGPLCLNEDWLMIMHPDIIEDIKPMPLRADYQTIENGLMHGEVCGYTTTLLTIISDLAR